MKFSAGGLLSWNKPKKGRDRNMFFYIFRGKEDNLWKMNGVDLLIFYQSLF